MSWINSEDRLPEEGRYVLGHAEHRPWFDDDDQEGCRFVVVRLVHGISLEERAALPNSDLRKITLRGEDECGNNERPYNWEPFGVGSFFGQEITRWKEIER